MSVRGWAGGCKWVDQGSELVSAASVGATSLAVDWVGDFDDDGGTLRLNDADLDYLTVDEDANTITLAAPLAVAAAVGDGVVVVSGDQVLKDYTLFVSVGEGDDVEVVIPFAERDIWPEGEYDDPIEVMLADDLESVESVPGRTPTRDATFTYMPAFWGVQAVNVPIPSSTWTQISWVYPFQQDRVTLNTDNTATVTVAGVYDIRFGVTFASSAVGARAIRFRFIDIFGGNYVSRAIKVPADGPVAIETAQFHRFSAGDIIGFEVWHNAGADLDVLGSSIFDSAIKTEAHVRWVGPL